MAAAAVVVVLRRMDLGCFVDVAQEVVCQMGIVRGRERRCWNLSQLAENTAAEEAARRAASKGRFWEEHWSGRQSSVYCRGKKRKRETENGAYLAIVEMLAGYQLPRPEPAAAAAVERPVAAGAVAAVGVDPAAAAEAAVGTVVGTAAAADPWRAVAGT